MNKKLSLSLQHVDNLPKQSAARGGGDQGQLLRLAEVGDSYARTGSSNSHASISRSYPGAPGGHAASSDAALAAADNNHHGRAHAGRATPHRRGPNTAAAARKRGQAPRGPPQPGHGRMPAPSPGNAHHGSSTHCQAGPPPCYLPTGGRAAGSGGGRQPPPPPPPPRRPAAPPPAPPAAALASPSNNSGITNRSNGCNDTDSLGYDAGPGYEIRRPVHGFAPPAPGLASAPPPPAPADAGPCSRAGDGGSARAPAPARPAAGDRHGRDDRPAGAPGAGLQGGVAAGTTTPGNAELAQAKPAAGGSPFAAVPPPAPAAAAPRNEFAERLAQRAMAAATRTSLLSGSQLSSSSSSSPVGSFSSFDAAASVVLVPAAAERGTTTTSSSKLWSAAPLADDAPGAARPAAAAEASSASAADRVSTGSASAPGRPRLNLLPRSGSASAGGQQQRSASVFGGAKPREEVLRERGVDAGSLPAGGGGRLSEAAVARLGSAPHGSAGGPSSSGSAHSAEDKWCTVSGRRGRAAGGSGRSGNLGALDDPFFGSGSGSFKAGGGVFGRSGWAGGWGGREEEAAEEEDGDLFCRALPTRQHAFAGL